MPGGVRSNMGDETPRANTVAALRERVAAGDVGVGGPLVVTFLLAFLAAVTGLILLVTLAGMRASAPGSTVLTWVTAWNALLYVPAVAAIALYVHGEDSRIRDLFAFNRERLPRDVGRGLLLAVGLVAVDAAIEYSLARLTTGLWGSSFPVEPAFPAPAVVLVLVATSLLAGVVEEAMYRGYALPRLAARTTTPVGIAVTAVGFGLHHTVLAFYATPPYAVVRGAGVLAVGVLLGWFYVRENERLVPLVVAHAVWAFVSVGLFGLAGVLAAS